MNNHRIKSLYNFQNKVVIITGSNGQIGFSLVKLFLDLGSKVYGFDKFDNKFNEENYEFIKTDISIKKNIINKISQIIKIEKKIDIIINNAGVSVFTKYNKRTDLEINSTVDVNIKGVMNMINVYSEIHKKKKLNKCNIVNISSIYGLLSPDFRVYGKNDRFNSEIYGATKAAVIQLTKYYAVILSKDNININSISPGGIFNKKKPQNKNFIKKYSSRVPKGRMGEPEDLFTGILFLCSDQSNYIIGQNLVIDGGLSIW
jgi:NAD(P)-dependent dehydrogenase (short-subunit alcohol dehydrogenase family)